jgi:hypothetical protein
MSESRSLGQPVGWWVGIVTNVMDPHRSGRVQVRVFGRHDDKINIPDQHLPWAQVMQSATSAALGRIGTAPVGLVVGSRVVGMWADHDYQYPIIQGTIGKAGDAKSGSTSGGAPEIDITVGSIPAASQQSVSNPYSVLNPNRISIDQIDGGQEQGLVDSVKVDDGIVMTKQVEEGMYYADVPTIASAEKGTEEDVLQIFRKVDPQGKISVLPCLPFNALQINIQLDLTSLISGIVGIVANAIRNAILELARKLGIQKILAALNEAAYAINSVRKLIDALARTQICGISVLNNGTAASADLALAQAVSSINGITGYTRGALNYVKSSSLDRDITGILNIPLARVPVVSFSPLGGVQVEPPIGYIQEYYSYNNDPYPGYIRWVDPMNIGNPIYTLRNGQPNFGSAQQHTQYATQQALVTSLGSEFVKGSISGPGLVSAIQGSMNFAKAFGAAKAMGNGYSIGSLISMAASLIPLLVQGVSSVLNPKVSVSIVGDKGAFNSLGRDFMQKQAMMSRRSQLLFVGVT